MDAVLFALSKYYQKHPVNLILLGLYTLCMSVAVGFIHLSRKYAVEDLEKQIYQGYLALVLHICTNY